MEKKKLKYQGKFFDWLFWQINHREKKPKTQEDQKRQAEMNGGWIDHQLFIPLISKREIMFRYANVWKTIFFFSLPTIVLMVVQGLYNILDKTLSLTFATDHAIHNWNYLRMMIVGDGSASSIIQQAILDNHNPAISNWEIFNHFFNTSQTPDLQSAVEGLDWSNHDAVKNFFEQQVSERNIWINPAKMKEYINVTTQYTFQTYTLAYAFSQVMSIGCGMHFATEFGRGNRAKLAEISGNGMTQSFLVSLLITFLAFAISFRPWGQVMIRSQMGGHPNLVVEALAWNDILPFIVALPVVFTGSVMLNTIRSEGKMVQVMLMILTSLGVKMLVSITAMKYGGLELAGAQLGTVAAFVYQFFYCLVVVFFSKVSYSRFRAKDLIKLKKENWQATISAGIPNFINYLSIMINSYAVTAIVIQLPIPSAGPSIEENGGVSIMQQLISSMAPWSDFILSACIGLNQGVRTVIAYNYGAQNNKRIVDVLRRSTWLMLGWFVFILALIIAVGPYMVIAFAFPKEYISYGNIFYWYQILYFFTYPFACMTYVAFGLFQGTSRSRAATIAVSFRTILVFLPLLGIGYGFTLLANDSIWFFVMIGLTDFVSACLILPMIWQFYVRAKQANHLKTKPESLIDQAAYAKTMYQLTHKAKYFNQFYQLVRDLQKEHFVKDGVDH